MTSPVLDIRDLVVSLGTEAGALRIIDGISLTVAALDETRPIEALTERGHDEVQVARRQTTEKSNQGRGRLLCARRERPSCAPDERNQLAPPDMNCHVALRAGGMQLSGERYHALAKDEQCLRAAKVLSRPCLRWVKS